METAISRPGYLSSNYSKSLIDTLKGGDSVAVEMVSELTLAHGNGIVKKGEHFELDDELARIYEQKGLARKTKKQEPSRTQDVQAESDSSEESPKRRGRPPKTRQTKGEDSESSGE